MTPTHSTAADAQSLQTWVREDYERSELQDNTTILKVYDWWEPNTIYASRNDGDVVYPIRCDLDLAKTGAA